MYIRSRYALFWLPRYYTTFEPTTKPSSSKKQNNPRKQVVVVEVIPGYSCSASSSSFPASGIRGVSTVTGAIGGTGPSPVTNVPLGVYGCSVEGPGEPVWDPESPVDNVLGIMFPSPRVNVGVAAGGMVFASPVWKVFGMTLPLPSWRVPVGVPKSTPT